jgi:hypothetical protein
MYTSLYRAVRSRVGARLGLMGEPFLSPETREREKKIQTELELWGLQVKREAQFEASRGTGSLAFGGVEAQLKRVSEQVTREAQEKRRKASSQVPL